MKTRKILIWIFFTLSNVKKLIQCELSIENLFIRCKISTFLDLHNFLLKTAGCYGNKKLNHQ